MDKAGIYTNYKKGVKVMNGGAGGVEVNVISVSAQVL